MSFTFPKTERLCSKILIDKLFNEGNKAYSYPLKVLWQIITLPENVSLQCLVSVSKKRFKRANKRNLLKRRIREAYRLNKNQLEQIIKTKNLQLAIIILYNTNELHEFDLIQEQLIEIFADIIKRIEGLQHS